MSKEGPDLKVKIEKSSIEEAKILFLFCKTKLNNRGYKLVIPSLHG